MTKDELLYLVPYQPRGDIKDFEFYRDLDLMLIPHPRTRDLKPKINADAIKRSLRHIFMWRRWDVPFNPTYHNYIMDLLFELNTIFTKASIRSRAEWLINTFEPRVKVLSVDVTATHDEAGYDISITYVIKNVRVEDNLNLFFQRVR